MDLQQNILGHFWRRNELFEEERWITLPFHDMKDANILLIFHVTQQEIHNSKKLFIFYFLGLHNLLMTVLFY